MIVPSDHLNVLVSVAELGDHRLRLASSGVDWNNPKLVGQLFSLYFGSSSPAAKPVVSSSAVREAVFFLALCDYRRCPI